MSCLCKYCVLCPGTAALASWLDVVSVPLDTPNRILGFIDATAKGLQSLWGALLWQNQGCSWPLRRHCSMQCRLQTQQALMPGASSAAGCSQAHPQPEAGPSAAPALLVKAATTPAPAAAASLTVAGAAATALTAARQTALKQALLRGRIRPKMWRPLCLQLSRPSGIGAVISSSAVGHVCFTMPGSLAVCSCFAQPNTRVTGAKGC
jgi:hypothetical protein